MKDRWAVIGIVAAVLVVAALGARRIAGEPGSTGSGTTLPGGPHITPVDPGAVADPVRAGAPLPRGYRVLLGRDRIRPVYNPSFRSAADSGWQPDTLVIGIAGTSTAKAYPVAYLNRREMVNDTLEGTPILVSW